MIGYKRIVGRADGNSTDTTMRNESVGDSRNKASGGDGVVGGDVERT